MAANKHQQKTEATQRKLLAAALRVFSRDGFEASRIEDIAAEAGHTRGAFYANFESKEDLFLALLEQQATGKLKDLQTRLEKRAAPKERLAAVREFYLERVADREWVMLRLEFKLFALRHPKARASLAAAQQRIRASLDYDAVARLLPMKGRHTQADELDKVILEVLLAGLVLEHSYNPEGVSAKQTVAALGRVFDLLTARRSSAAL